MDFQTAKEIIISRLNNSNELPDDLKPTIAKLIKGCRCSEVSVSLCLDDFLVSHVPISKPAVKFPSPEKCEKMCRYFGKNIVFTGFSQEEKESLVPTVETLEIHIAKSVCKAANFVVCGANAGPAKQAKAKEMGIELVPVKKFIDEITKKDNPV